MNTIIEIVSFIKEQQNILNRDISKDSEYSIFNCHNCGTDRIQPYFKFCDQCGIKLVNEVDQ